MTSIIRIFLIVQTAVFAYAATAHFGILGNRDDSAAGTAEAIIAAALLAGLAISFANVGATRTAALAGQGFALLGTVVGFTLVLTVGPTTGFDVGMHVTMLMLLVSGLAVTYRSAGAKPPATSILGQR